MKYLSRVFLLNLCFSSVTPILHLYDVVLEPVFRFTDTSANPMNGIYFTKLPQFQSVTQNTALLNVSRFNAVRGLTQEMFVKDLGCGATTCQRLPIEVVPVYSVIDSSGRLKFELAPSGSDRVLAKAGYLATEETVGLISYDEYYSEEDNLFAYVNGKYPNQFGACQLMAYQKYRYKHVRTLGFAFTAVVVPDNLPIYTIFGYDDGLPEPPTTVSTSPEPTTPKTSTSVRFGTNQIWTMLKNSSGGIQGLGAINLPWSPPANAIPLEETNICLLTGNFSLLSKCGAVDRILQYFDTTHTYFGSIALYTGAPDTFIYSYIGFAFQTADNICNLPLEPIRELYKEGVGYTAVAGDDYEELEDEGYHATGRVLGYTVDCGSAQNGGVFGDIPDYMFTVGPTPTSSPPTSSPSTSSPPTSSPSTSSPPTSSPPTSSPPTSSPIASTSPPLSSSTTSSPPTSSPIASTSPPLSSSTTTDVAVTTSNPLVIVGIYVSAASNVSLSGYPSGYWYGSSLDRPYSLQNPLQICVFTANLTFLPTCGYTSTLYQYIDTDQKFQFFGVSSVGRNVSSARPIGLAFRSADNVCGLDLKPIRELFKEGDGYTAVAGDNYEPLIDQGYHLTGNIMGYTVRCENAIYQMISAHLPTTTYVTTTRESVDTSATEPTTTSTSTVESTTSESATTTEPTTTSTTKVPSSTLGLTTTESAETSTTEATTTQPHSTSSSTAATSPPLSSPPTSSPTASTSSPSTSPSTSLPSPRVGYYVDTVLIVAPTLANYQQGYWWGGVLNGPFRFANSTDVCVFTANSTVVPKCGYARALYTYYDQTDNFYFIGTESFGRNVTSSLMGVAFDSPENVCDLDLVPIRELYKPGTGYYVVAGDDYADLVAAGYSLTGYIPGYTVNCDFKEGGMVYGTAPQHELPSTTSTRHTTTDVAVTTSNPLVIVGIYVSAASNVTLSGYPSGYWYGSFLDRPYSLQNPLQICVFTANLTFLPTCGYTSTLYQYIDADQKFQFFGVSSVGRNVSSARPIGLAFRSADNVCGLDLKPIRELFKEGDGYTAVAGDNYEPLIDQGYHLTGNIMGYTVRCENAIYQMISAHLPTTTYVTTTRESVDTSATIPTTTATSTVESTTSESATTTEPTTTETTESTTTEAVPTTSCIGSWSEWQAMPDAVCNDTCGNCGWIPRHRICEPSGCQCEGVSGTDMYPCADGVCYFPRNSCCEPYKATVSGNRHVCALPVTAAPVETTTPCSGEWSDWEVVAGAVCNDTCGNCGALPRQRSCLTCGCIGDTADTIACADPPCLFPRTSCCSPYVKKVDVINRTIYCG